MKDHRIERLPKWAQNRITEAEAYAERVKVTHALMNGFDDWFTIGNLTPETRHLYMFDHDSCHAVCCVGDGDVLIVGRKAKTTPREASHERDE